MKYFHAQQNTKKEGQRGFTLFEMLVSIAIFTIITSVLLVKNSQFKGNIAITNLAYQMALAVRQAQSYGVNVRGLATGDTQNPFDYSKAYGVHFDTDQTTSGFGNTGFVIFGDSNDATENTSKVYDPNDAAIETFRLQQGNTILRFCAKSVQNTYCSDGADGSIAISALDASFVRPLPNATIYVRQVSPGLKVPVTSATVYVLSSRGICKAVQIDAVGQINVIEQVSITPQCP